MYNKKFSEHEITSSSIEKFAIWFNKFLGDTSFYEFIEKVNPQAIKNIRFFL